MPDIAAIIPARYESSRFPKKLTYKLLGKPIIIAVYDNIKACRRVNDCIVAADSNEIMDICKKNNAKSVMTSKDHTSGTSRIIEVAKKIDSEIIINVQGDEPLIDESVINPIIDAFDDENTHIVTLKTKIEGNSSLIKDENAVKVVTDINGYAMYFSRAAIPYKRFDQNINVEYYKHIGVYAFRRDILLKIDKLEECSYENIEKLEQLRWLYNGIRIKVLETNKFLHGIDTKEDLDIVQNYLRNFAESELNK
ncbi:3-deoxy-manno-octulosonate cytidylyltransferase [uncultured Brachyspira sp.]|uniref:3-deoxy-manno-octulosonate cytidylyltransferase n=1 Tax=uncultured Brachyspira sp. TaxID=221953 RepID=UPI0025F26CBE|nr:3-deoxy-manno-octulosonate cytidylyltransferase [uncultured Brachyspira sp.]